jgi:hypothetical protein
LKRRLNYTPPLNLWEEPVKEWFKPRWQMAKNWYAGEGSREYEDPERQSEELTARFMESEEARSVKFVQYLGKNLPKFI